MIIDGNSDSLAHFFTVFHLLSLMQMQTLTGMKWYYSDYARFYLDSETNKYKLHVAGNSGNGYDGLNEYGGLKYDSNLMPFSTPDNDNSVGHWMASYSCGYWFNGDYNSILTAPYTARTFAGTRCMSIRSKILGGFEQPG